MTNLDSVLRKKQQAKACGWGWESQVGFTRPRSSHSRSWTQARSPNPRHCHKAPNREKTEVLGSVVTTAGLWGQHPSPGSAPSSIALLRDVHYRSYGPGSIPGSGRSPGEGNGNPLQYSCLENPMDGGAWQATVHGVAKSRTRRSDFTSLSLFSWVGLGGLRGWGLCGSRKPETAININYIRYKINKLRNGSPSEMMWVLNSNNRHWLPSVFDWLLTCAPRSGPQLNWGPIHSGLPWWLRW